MTGPEAKPLEQLQQQAEQEELYKRALQLRPSDPAALRALSDLYQLQGRYDAAMAIADAAIAAEPDAPDGWMTRADTLANTGRAREAADAYRAVAARPTRVRFDALVRLGQMCARLDQAEEAMRAFDAALALRPDAPEPLYERGRMKLERREFATGWTDYEARWRMPSFLAQSRGQVPLQLAPALKTQPSLEDLRGRRVLVVGEQGIGDQVMFASMLPDLRATAAHVTCICEPRLLQLFATAFPDVTFMHPSGARIEDVDVLLAMGSLGCAFRNRADAFPGVPYLRAREPGRETWRERLGPRRKPLRLGLSWKGGLPATDRTSRSIALQDLAPILARPDCEFVSVQYGDVEAELAAVNRERDNPIRHVPAAAVHDLQDFADLLAELDGLISVQTAAVHLAGALGKPVLAMIPFVPAWRYMREGATMPWYGSVRLFRQPAPGAWRPVLRDVEASIAGLINADGTARPS